MKRILFLSPHLDDAVLSCGVRIHQSVQEGFEAIVASIFTSPGVETVESVQDLYLKRKRDDKRAIEFLGAKAEHLDFIDAPFRNKRYHNFSTILFHHQLPESEEDVVNAVSVRLRKLIEYLQPYEVHFPLGVGGHIDHHILFESSRLLWDIRTQFNYYEDLPYSLLSGWNAVRWQQLKARVVSKHQNPALVLKKMSLVDTSIPFVHNYLVNEQDRLSSDTYYDRELSGLQPDMCHAATWEIDHSFFSSQSYITLSQENFMKKCEAISYYTTEWPVLFGCDKNNIQHFLGATTQNNIYKEHYWLKKI